MADIAVVVAQVLVTGLLQFDSAMSGLPLIVKIGDLTWVNPVEKNHDEEHQRSVKDVQIHLVTEEISSIALDVFDDSKNASYEDKRTGSIQDVEMSFPRQFVNSFAGENSGNSSVGGVETVVAGLPEQGAWGVSPFDGHILDQTSVKVSSHADKKSKEDELNKKTADDDLLAKLHRIESSHRHDTSACENVNTADSLRISLTYQSPAS